MLFRVQKRPRLCNLACILTLCSCNQDIARFEKILYVFVSDFISFEEGVCTIILGTQYVRHVVQKKNELPTSCCGQLFFDLVHLLMTMVDEEIGRGELAGLTVVSEHLAIFRLALKQYSQRLFQVGCHRANTLSQGLWAINPTTARSIHRLGIVAEHDEGNIRIHSKVELEIMQWNTAAQSRFRLLAPDNLRRVHKRTSIAIVHIIVVLQTMEHLMSRWCRAALGRFMLSQPGLKDEDLLLQFLLDTTILILYHLWIRIKCMTLSRRRSAVNLSSGFWSTNSVDSIILRPGHQQLSFSLLLQQHQLHLMVRQGMVSLWSRNRNAARCTNVVPIQG